MIRLTLNGEVWEFSTAKDAIEFKQAMNASERPVVAPEKKLEKPKSRASVVVAHRRPTSEKTTTQPPTLSPESRHVLEIIRQSPGIRSEQFSMQIGMATTVVPLVMMRVRKELRALGFQPDDVIYREKFYEKGDAKSRFKPGPRMDEVLRREGDLLAAAK